MKRLSRWSRRFLRTDEAAHERREAAQQAGADRPQAADGVLTGLKGAVATRCGMEGN